MRLINSFLRALDSILKAKILILLSIAILLASSCNVLKFVPKETPLVERNRVKIVGGEKIEDLKDQILLVPNRKLFGVLKFNLWAYYFGQKLFKNDSVTGRIVYKTPKKKIVSWGKKENFWSKRFGHKIFKNDSVIGRIVYKEKKKKKVTRGKKINKVKRFFTEIVGEKPIYLDSVLIKRSEKNMQQYLYQKGFYQATVESKAKTIFKRSYITYTVKPGSPYVLRQIEYNGSDFILDKKANEFVTESLLKKGDPVVFDKLTEERDRLTAAFRNDGFYYFNKAFINILVDTGGHNRGAYLNYNIANPGELRNARQQTINKVEVEMNFKQQFGRKYTVTYKSIDYVFNGYNIKPNIINRSIRLRPNDLFSQSDLEATYKKLIGLGLFNQVNIRIAAHPSDSNNMLNIFISLTPASKHDFIWEPQTITSDKQTNLTSGDNNPRNYGLANSFTLNNKNVFRNAEAFNIKWRIAAEKQFGQGAGGTKLELLGRKFTVGNFETNLTFEFLFPKLVGIHRLDTNPNLQLNRTSLNVTYLIEINTNYNRKSVPINFTYKTFFETKNKQSFNIYYSPIQLSFNESHLNEDFLNGLSAKDRKIWEDLFRSYIIPSQKLAIVYSNMEKSPKKYWNVRTNLFELSGNLMELSYRIIKKDNSIDKNMFGIPYFQYFRTDIDAVRYRSYGKNKTLIFRLNSGFGLPYGNSGILPFERQFFVGGSNNLRGWKPRVLGPGEFRDIDQNVQVDKTGDLMIVTNSEYRFAVAPGFLYGAFFIDMGNIWQIAKGDSNTRFKLNSFYKQLAINSGIGARFDFGFFIVRMDWGIPLHDPSELKKDRWVIKDFFKKEWIFTRTVLNVAVGYPF